ADARIEVPTAGDHTLAFVVDWSGAVAEDNETNNEVAATFHAAAEPYLDAVALSLHVPQYAAVGETVPVEARVRFDGTPRDGDVQFVARFYLDGAPIGWSSHFIVDGPYETTIWSEAVAVTAGWHWVEVVLDTEDWVLETSEANNVAAASLHVREGRPDLAVRVLPVEREQVRTDLGTLVTNPWTRIVRVEVCNHGTGEAFWGELDLRAEGRSSAYGLAYMDVHQYLGVMAPGECRTYSWRWTGHNGVGDYRWVARVDVPGDANGANDVDVEEDFVLVGGLNVGIVAWA
ncbi:MAG TPA: hypothetical protein VNX21_04315, partial [Candidatus Thermoplasmatota archaeon]|nr:hypothetical protein [Candidatus Thermoplasmatota archaeon]